MVYRAGAALAGSRCRRFAQLVLCETPGAQVPCGKCDGCRWFLAGQHPDFRQVEPEALAPLDLDEDAPAASKTAKPSHEIKVDQVRGLADFLNIGSHRGKRRLALFHPAEAMNANAANSLLKSLEDPASGACFILISDNAKGLLPTVRSRCISLPVAIPEKAVAVASACGLFSPAHAEIGPEIDLPGPHREGRARHHLGFYF